MSLDDESMNFEIPINVKSDFKYQAKVACDLFHTTRALTKLSPFDIQKAMVGLAGEFFKNIKSGLIDIQALSSRFL